MATFDRPISGFRFCLLMGPVIRTLERWPQWPIWLYRLYYSPYSIFVFAGLLFTNLSSRIPLLFVSLLCCTVVLPMKVFFLFFCFSLLKPYLFFIHVFFLFSKNCCIENVLIYFFSFILSAILNIVQGFDPFVYFLKKFFFIH